MIEAGVPAAETINPDHRVGVKLVSDPITLDDAGLVSLSQSMLNACPAPKEY